MVPLKSWRVPSRRVALLLRRQSVLDSRGFATCAWYRPTPSTTIRQLPQQRTGFPHAYSTASSQTTSQSSATRPPGKSVSETAVDRIHREFVLDEDINGRFIQVKDSTTGKLQPPQTLISILSTMDRDKEFVLQLGAPANGPIIVEITTREELYAKLQAKDAAQAAQVKKMRETKPKQIELNWAISGNDLDMKMKQLKEFVEKGKRVEILLAAKRRQRKATPEEAQNVVKHIRKTISEIEKCKEIIPMDGQIGGQALMTVQKIKG